MRFAKWRRIFVRISKSTFVEAQYVAPLQKNSIMPSQSNHFAETAMLVRRPVSEVFEAFIYPEITAKFWFTKSSGKLEEGEKREWTWEMYNHVVPVAVKSIIPNEKILIEWGNYQQTSTVEWTFKDLGDATTFVTINNHDFKGSTEEVISQIRDSTEGFTWVLAGLKAYLEHGVALNAIADRFPTKLNDA